MNITSIFKDKTNYGHLTLWVVGGFGILLILYRFVAGLGAVTNLSDGYPWGFWIGVDILSGIALASGGFVMAGLVHLFGGRRYHALARPAILTAFLGYLMFIGGMIVDVGRPWNIWRPIFSWNHESPMFEVAWCVTLYTTVLLLEFLPAVFERWHLQNLRALWEQWVPWIVVAMLTMFTLAMTYSVIWAAVMLIVLSGWELCIRKGWMPRDRQMPILLIMSGIIFSTMHQSSLGTLFLMAPHKLHILWYTPIIPILFFLTAVMAAPAMIILEAILSARFLGHKDHFELLSSLSTIMPPLLAGYLVLKVIDIVVRGAAMAVFTVSAQSISWWLEICVGVMVPLILFSSSYVRESRPWLLFSSLLVVLGVIWNRLNVSVVGIRVEEWETYYPFWTEILISAGIVSLGLIAFAWVAKNLPIYQEA